VLFRTKYEHIPVNSVLGAYPPAYDNSFDTLRERIHQIEASRRYDFIAVRLRRDRLRIAARRVAARALHEVLGAEADDAAAVAARFVAGIPARLEPE
jgi:hypothetical protein